MLKEISWKIAKKCKGLPLAAKTMGGLLHYKTSLQDWEDVLNIEMWKLKKMDTDVFPFLALSYNALHPAVKRCFTYFAVFPTDMKLNVDELIRVWMAQGYLSSSGTDASQMELRGREYFDDLAMRSLFQEFEKDQIVDNNRIVMCKMHDIVHDFAQFLSKNECLIVERLDEGPQKQVHLKVRHLNMLQDRNGTPLIPYSICETEKLRSICCRTTKLPPNLTAHLKRVGLLSLQGCHLLSIPEEIGCLIHLRYLDLSGNPLKQLPQTIYDLYNLQTLDVQLCTDLSGLPQGIHKLRNLRHLLNRGVAVKFQFPRGFEKLTNMQTLNKLYFTRGCNQLGYLKDLNQLGGQLEILVVDLNETEATKPELTNKKFLQELTLNCGRYGPEITEALQPSPMLQVLFFGGIQLPKWITTITYLRRLTYVGIRINNNHSPLPPLGELRFLEVLNLFDLEMGHLGCELLGKNRTAFQELRSLRFKSCMVWEEWEDISEEQENSGFTNYLAWGSCKYLSVQD